MSSVLNITKDMVGPFTVNTVTMLETAGWDPEVDGLDTMERVTADGLNASARVTANGVNASAATTKEEVSL